MCILIITQQQLHPSHPQIHAVHASLHELPANSPVRARFFGLPAKFIVAVWYVTAGDCSVADQSLRSHWLGPRTAKSNSQTPALLVLRSFSKLFRCQVCGRMLAPAGTSVSCPSVPGWSLPFLCPTWRLPSATHTQCRRCSSTRKSSIAGGRRLTPSGAYYVVPSLCSTTYQV